MPRSSNRSASRHRFSGPELAEVLRRVHDEHGSTATIAEVNRVRAGGIVGFFAREEFEVVVERHPVGPDGGPDPSWDDDPHGLDDPAGLDELDLDDPVVRDGSVVPPSREVRESGRRFGRRSTDRVDPDPGSDPGYDPVDRWLEGDDDGDRDVDGDGPSAAAGRAAHPDGAVPRGRFGGVDDGDPELRPDGRPGTIQADERFRALLEQALADREAAEDRTALLGRSGPTAPAPAPAPRSGPTALTGPSVAIDVDCDILPRTTRRTEMAADVTVEEPVAEQPVRPRAVAPAPHPGPTPSVRSGPALPGAHPFWSQRERALDTVAPVTLAQPPMVAVVGPLRSIVPIVRRLERHEEGPGQRSVLVLTNRAEIASQPNWQIVRHGTRLAGAASSARGPLVVTVDTDGDHQGDTELPIWVPPLLARLRRSGVELVRLALPSPPDQRTLTAVEQAFGGRILFDLLTAIGPERVLRLVESGAPVGSVGGVPMTAELLVALRHEAGRG